MNWFYIGLEDKDEEMSLDGMSIDSEQHGHHEGESSGRPESPDEGVHSKQSPQSAGENCSGRPAGNYDADSSRPSVIETANKAPPAIECT